MTSVGMKAGESARPLWPPRQVDRMVFTRGLALHDGGTDPLLGEVVDLGVLMWVCSSGRSLIFGWPRRRRCRVRS
jgi:hypothetical protein